MLDTTKFSHEFRTPLHHILGFLSLVLNDPDLSSHHRCHLQQVHDAAMLLMSKINQHLGVEGKSSGYQQHVSDDDLEADSDITLDTAVQTNIPLHILSTSTFPSTSASPSPSPSLCPSPSCTSQNIPNFPFETKSSLPPSPSKTMSPIKSRSTSSSPSPSTPTSPSSSLSSPQRGLIRRTSFNVEPIPIHLQPIRILAADDTMGNCKLLSQFCLKLDIDIEFAANGQECYDKFIARQTSSHDDPCEDATWNYQSTVFGSVLKGPPTLIIMDLDMPIVNGITSAQMIREYEQKHHLTHTPIISLSATTSEDELVEGMDASLSKPISITTFRDSIVAWAEYRASQNTLAAISSDHLEFFPSKTTLLPLPPSQCHRRIHTTIATSCINATTKSSSSSIPTYSHDTCSILQLQSRPKVETLTSLHPSQSTTQLLSSTSRTQRIHSNHSSYPRHNVGI